MFNMPLSPPANSYNEQDFLHHIGLAIDHPNSALSSLACFELWCDRLILVA